MESYIFDKQIVEEWEKELDEEYAIPDPNNNLIEIYEIDTMKDLLLIKAEKWKSSEHQYDINKGGKAPLNVQNPNYTDLLALIRGIQKQSSNLKKEYKELKELKTFKDKKVGEDENLEIDKKVESIKVMEKKRDEAWNKFISFVNTMKDMPRFCLLSLMKNGEENNISNIKIYKMDSLPDVRMIRFMLKKSDYGINNEIINLMCSYLYMKYVS